MTPIKDLPVNQNSAKQPFCSQMRTTQSIRIVFMN